MNKLKIFLIIAGCSAVAFLLTILKPEVKKVEKIEQGTLVEVFSAKPEAAYMIVETYGTLQPAETVRFIAEVGGRIVEVSPLFVEGGYVRKGTELLTIDRRAFELEFERRRAGRKQAEAAIEIFRQNVENLKSSIRIALEDVKLAEAEFIRLKKLFKSKVIAESTLDKAGQIYLKSFNNLKNLTNQMELTASQEEELEARKDMASAVEKQALLDLEKTLIKAPFNGYILEKRVRKGEYLNAGTYIGNIYKENLFEVSGNIRERDFKWIMPDIDNKKSFDTDVIFEGSENTVTWHGKAVRTKSAIDINTRTLPVLVELDATSYDANKGIPPRPGMFVRLFIKGKREDGIYVLPREVIHENDTVYLMEESRLKKRDVRILKKFEEKVYIEAGIDEDDLIIKTDIPGAIEDMAVRISEEKETEKIP